MSTSIASTLRIFLLSSASFSVLWAACSNSSSGMKVGDAAGLDAQDARVGTGGAVAATGGITGGTGGTAAATGRAPSDAKGLLDSGNLGNGGTGGTSVATGGAIGVDAAAGGSGGSTGVDAAIGIDAPVTDAPLLFDAADASVPHLDVAIDRFNGRSDASSIDADVCGNLDTVCCAQRTCNSANLICTNTGAGSNGTCVACGGSEQPCCANDTCTAPGTTCSGGGRAGGTCR